MDPIEFRVEQVNFEEDSLQLRDSESELDSFSSLINCNYSFDGVSNITDANSPVSPRFRLADSTTEAIRKRKGKNNTRLTKCVTAPVTSICERVDDQTVQLNPSGSDSTDISDPSDPSETRVTTSPVTTLNTVTSNSLAVSRHLANQGRRVQHILVHKHRPLAMDNTAETSSGAAFDTVAEALHLQQSVIGDPSIIPASPEAIALAIAEAQKKITPLKSQTPSMINASGDAHYAPETHSSPVLGYSGDCLPLTTSPINQPVLASPRESDTDLTGPIPVNKLIMSPNVTTKVVQESMSSLPRQLVLTPKSSDCSVHSEEQLSETSSVDYILDTEAFLNSLPPIKPLDIAAFVSAAKEDVIPEIDDTFPVPMQNTYGDSIVPLGQPEEPELRPLDQLVDRLLSEKGKIAVSKPYVPVTVEPLFGERKKVRSVESSGIATTSSSIKGQTGENIDVDGLRKEKAKLEGQVEMLMSESEAVMLERAELQTQVAALKQQIKQHSGKLSDAEKEALLVEIAGLKKKCFHIEQALIDVQKMFDDKETEASTLSEELQLSKDLCENLQRRMKELHEDMKGKEVTIQGLKNKIAELFIDVQNAMQAKMQSDNEMRSAKNDIATLVNTKEWYQQQLQTAHEERSELQKQFSKVHAQVASQTLIVDRLKCDNSQLRQQLSHLQQRALSEKESLARHLEKIEADIVNRESAYEDMQRERSVIEDTLNTKLHDVGEESVKMSQLVDVTSDLETRLLRSQESLQRRAKQIEDLEIKQMTLFRDLTVSQTSLSERDKTVQELEHRLIEVDAQLKAFQNDITTKDGVILKLNEDRASAEIALSSTLQEKKSVDDALEELRADMTKVGNSFRQMKQELNNRLTDLEEMKNNKQAVVESLDIAKSQVKELETTRTELHNVISNKDNIIFDLTSQRDKLNNELNSLNTQYEDNKAHIRDQECRVPDLSVSDNQMLVAESVQKHLNDSLIKSEMVSSETQTTLETWISIKTALMGNGEDKITQTEGNSQKDLLKEKAKAAKLRSELVKLQQEFNERQKLFDSNLGQMSETLRETIGEKERLLGEVEKIQRRFDLSMVETKDQLHTQLQALAVEGDMLREKRSQLEMALLELQQRKEMEAAEYESQLAALGEELHRVSAAHEMRANDVEREMSVELEKERGRVAGLIQNQQNLKQHIGSVEEALANRESAITELQERIEDTESKSRVRDEEYRMRVDALESSLATERDAHRSVRKQVGLKITEKKRLLQQFEKMRLEHECLHQEVTSKEDEINELRIDAERSLNSERFHQSECERLKAEIYSLSADVDRYRRDAQRSAEQEPMAAKKIEMLEWMIEQKNGELLALQSHVKMSEDQHRTEVTNLNENLQSVQNETERLRGELTAAKGDCTSLKGKVAELRTALKATIHSHKMNKKLNEACKLNGADDMIYSENDIDIIAMETLLEETATKSADNKTLNNLHECLSSLRGQISSLQQQIDDHTTAMNTSLDSWSSVTAQVEDLRHVMRTVCADDSCNTVSTVTMVSAITEEPEEVGHSSAVTVV